MSPGGDFQFGLNDVATSVMVVTYENDSYFCDAMPLDTAVGIARYWIIRRLEHETFSTIEIDRILSFAILRKRVADQRARPLRSQPQEYRRFWIAASSHSSDHERAACGGNLRKVVGGWPSRTQYPYWTAHS